jgi:tRNA A-37 threonylcarbamoyl transferase component Bud32
MSSIRFTQKYAIKSNVSYDEFKIHKYVYHLGIVNMPRIVSYDESSKVMKMQRIYGSSVADFYGENIVDIPSSILTSISNILKKLTSNNIEYPDITGYNFMLDEDTNEIWIIDFEHAKYKEGTTNEFILKSCEKIDRWNPEFM